MNFPESVYTLDLLFALFVILFGLNGLRRGLSGELAHVLTLAVTLCGICFFYPTLTQKAAREWSTLSPMLVQIVVGVAMGLAAFLLFFIGQMLFKAVLKARLGEVSDKLAGSLMGLIRGSVIGLTLFGALSLVPGERIHTILSEKSTVGSWVCNTLTPWAHPKLMELPVFDRQEN